LCAQDYSLGITEKTTHPISCFFLNNMLGGGNATAIAEISEFPK
jgi:hypothetical protein